MRPVKIFSCLFFIIHSALAWDPLGHMIVGEIAYRKISPTVRQKVEASLAAFNATHKTAYDFVTAGCWMDDIRSNTREFNTWHYIEAPFTPSGEPLPSGPNVLWAIELCIGIIKGQSTYTSIDKDQALVMLLHLVGDAHQPLHATGNNDAGGNRVFITNLQDPLLALFNTQPNLHFLWDSAYRLKFENGAVVPVFFVPPQTRDDPIESHHRCLPIARVQADAILQEIALDEGVAAVLSPKVWVLDSHAIGYKAGYKSLPGGPHNRSVTLTADYMQTATAITRARLALAGERLARLLSQLFQ